MFNEVLSLWQIGLIIVGVIITVKLALQHIQFSKRLDKIQTLASILTVYKRQLDAFKDKDNRLLIEINRFDDSPKHRALELRFINNVNKEIDIINNMNVVLSEIHSLDPSTTESDYANYNREVNRITLLKQQVKRITARHKALKVNNVNHAMG